MNPIKAGTNKHPTGQAINVQSCIKENRTLWRDVAKRVGRVIDRLPYTKQKVSKDEAPSVSKTEKRTQMLTNHLLDSRYIWAMNGYDVSFDLKVFSTNAVRYDYLVTSELMDRTMTTINNILIDDLLSGSNFWTHRFWLDTYIDYSFEDGVIDSVESAKLITDGIEDLSLLNAQYQLQTPQYLDRLQLVHGRVFEEMKGLTADMMSALRLTLTEGMARGVGVRDLKGMINKRLSVGMVRAERIARTEINQAYRTAYMDEAKELNDTYMAKSKYKIMQVHRSALTDTTRPHHAARHGNVYTMEQQREWWAKNANAINCYCSTMDVLIDRKTGEILQDEMIEDMKKERKQWVH